MARICLCLCLVAMCFAGCGDRNATTTQSTADSPAPDSAPPADKVAAARAKLPPEDRALVEAQEWCAVTPEERLGSMGTPIKLDIKGKPVFICCKGCRKAAVENPDKTLAAVEELKAKVKAEKAARP